jgi:shikimate dehydrogenase
MSEAPAQTPVPRAGVLGWPVRHSLSPRLHGHWLARYGLAGSYEHLPVPPAVFEAYVRALADAGTGGGFVGANVTVPHKEAALALCDQLDPAAAAIGAVNTLIFRHGKIVGRNTDAFGFLENLRQAAPDWHAGDGPAVVLGAGGAARAVAYALATAGAPEVRILNRTVARAERLAVELSVGPDSALVGGPLDPRELEGAALLVNTTSLGMAGHPPLDLDLSALPATALVADIVYVPLETPLLALARARGHRTVDGLGMLLHQARPGFEAWFGRAPEVDADLRAQVLAALGAT